MIEFRRLCKEDAEDLSAFASKIVKKHFDPLIGAAQNDYMISLFQTPEAIGLQIEHGYRYYAVYHNGIRAGFMAFFPKEGKMYLSKFYVHEDFRGKHISTAMFEFVKEQTAAEQLHEVYLNVNKGNTDVIEVYRHLGFTVVREEKNDIGSGFYMDDYVMECRIG